MSAEVNLPATERSKRFGYLIWPKRLDAEMASLLGERDSCEVVFDGRNLGEKRVDWKHRRISVGPSQTRGSLAVAFWLRRGEGPTTITVDVERSATSS